MSLNSATQPPQWHYVSADVLARIILRSRLPTTRSIKPIDKTTIVGEVLFKHTLSTLVYPNQAIPPIAPTGVEQ